MGPKMGRLNLTSGMRGARGELKLRECERCGYSIASRIPPGRFIWVDCVLGCWVVVFASVCMCVRSWVRLANISGACPGGLLGHFGSSVGGLGTILGSLGISWGPCLGVWGLPWAPFLRLRGSSGGFGVPLAAQVLGRDGRCR